MIKTLKILLMFISFDSSRVDAILKVLNKKTIAYVKEAIMLELMQIAENDLPQLTIDCDESYSDKGTKLNGWLHHNSDTGIFVIIRIVESKLTVTIIHIWIICWEVRGKSFFIFYYFFEGIQDTLFLTSC